jgi:hypothetical protein
MLEVVPERRQHRPHVRAERESIRWALVEPIEDQINRFACLMCIEDPAMCAVPLFAGKKAQPRFRPPRRPTPGVGSVPAILIPFARARP